MTLPYESIFLPNAYRCLLSLIISNGTAFPGWSDHFRWRTASIAQPPDFCKWAIRVVENKRNTLRVL